MSETHHVGQRISYDGAICTVRYVGPLPGATGTWLGVEWDIQDRGKHDGSHKDVRYFTCISRSPNCASFIRPTRRADWAQSFLCAVRNKYAAEENQDLQIITFGKKPAQEMGFDKIRMQQGRLEDLTNVILDGMRTYGVRDEEEEEEGKTVKGVCPSITNLDLSRNLFERFGIVVDICRELEGLRKLSVNGNRFQDLMEDETLRDGYEALKSIKELTVEDTLLTWEEICHITSRCVSLTSLRAGMNQLTSLPTIDYASLTGTLTAIDLEYNNFTSLSDLASLTSLTSLRNLHLKGNKITSLSSDSATAPIFPPSVQYLDVSFNQISDWSFVDSLTKHFPGLTALRLTHNPVYDAPPDSSNAKGGSNASSTEDAHMFTIARVSTLKALNFTSISSADRSNAEMFYLSRIARQLASVPEAAEASIKAQHPRYAELCEIYGEPDIIRRDEINPSFLEARLVTVGFSYDGTIKKTKIPRSFDVYAVKGIAGKLLGLSPLSLKLIWETGEWDPVAGFYEKDDGGDSSDEEDMDVNNVPDAQTPGTGDEEATAEGDQARWVKREVELKDGPRQLGYCVDGLDATIRVEKR